MLARALEPAGVSTVSLVLIKEHAQRTKPPRALFVPFPYGYALGKPDDPAFQHKVIAAALELLKATEAPVLAEFPNDAGAPARLIQASTIQKTNREGDPAQEITAMRRYYERWVEEHNGRTQVGNTDIPQRRFRGLVRSLESYAAGRALPEPYPEALEGLEGRGADVLLPNFIRQASDDLKAFMLEARMAQRPQDRDNTLQEWFWAETAVGALLARLAAKLKEEGEERASFGIAR